MIAINRINKLDGSLNVKAFADIIYDGKILIKGIRVIEVNNERFVRMPDKKEKDDKWHPIVSFLDINLRKEVEDLVLAEYAKL